MQYSYLLYSFFIFVYQKIIFKKWYGICKIIIEKDKQHNYYEKNNLTTYSFSY